MAESILFDGDALRRLPDLDAASIDAVVTDPPYGLGFLGHDWDHGVPGEHFWSEILRVTKPGGHLLAFGGTRTHHRLMVAIEDAGWEIRDVVSWMHGQGFPKSMDVGKAIDKVDGRERGEYVALALHIKGCREAAGFSRSEVASWFPQYREVTKNWERTDPNGLRVPTPEDWQILRSRLGVSDEFLALVERVAAEREVVGRGRGAGNGSVVGLGSPRSMASEFDITVPSTTSAQQWKGWGTALKPAWEPIILARKPLVGGVASNVLEYGTGALNVDASRVPTTDRFGGGSKMSKTGRAAALLGNGGYEAGDGWVPGSSSGRFPANVVLSHHEECAATGCHPECPVGLLDETASASRFFYCAKASRRERNAGLPEGMRNDHPTVKPVELLRYLVRMVTPPGGLVLDPFMGSGSTGVAAVREGFGFVGIDLNPEYVTLARYRIEAAL